MFPIKRENNQALYPSQISIALSAIALALLQALLISALSSTPSYAAESLTNQLAKEKVDRFCNDPITKPLEQDKFQGKDLKRLNYALVKRCFKKLADKDTSCPLGTNASSNYAKYDTAYENAMKHWIDSDLKSKRKWKSKLIDELLVYYKTFNDRCIPKLATQACKKHDRYNEKTQDNAAKIQSCSKYYAGIIKWCILNKKDIRTCDNESYNTPELKLNECMRKALFMAEAHGSPKNKIKPDVFASTLKLDEIAIGYSIRDKDKLQSAAFTHCSDFAHSDL